MTQARADLADLVNRVAYSGERIMLTRHGKPLAALVPVADLDHLERPVGIGFVRSPAGPAEPEGAAQPAEQDGRDGHRRRAEPGPEAPAESRPDAPAEFPPPGRPPVGPERVTPPGAPLRIAARYRRPED